MTYKVFTLSLLLLLSYTVFGQIAVESFEKREKDMRARIDYPKIDQNGDKCALIIIETPLDNLHFYAPGSGIFHAEQKVGEWWIYVSYGARLLTIQHPQLGILRDYRYPMPIEEATVYLMKITSARVTTIIEEPEIQTEWVVIQSEPDGAQVYINDRPVGRTPYSGELNIGQHTYRVDLPMYHPEAGTFTLSADAGRHDIDLNLRPAFGSIRITSKPESGAEVLLNGEPTGLITPCTLENIRSGTHTITIKKDMYYDAWEEVTIEDNKTTQVNIEMRPAYGIIKITTNPEADIFINTEKVAHGSHKVRKLTGFYNIEAKKDKHTPASRRVEVKDGEEITVNLNPTPQYGQLRIATTPPHAEIFLDGKKMGITPVTLREVLIGDYKFELKKEGYANIIKDISIEHNKTFEVEETLSDSKLIRINSNPSGADCLINNSSVGKTPLETQIPFGNNSIVLSKDNYKTLKESIYVTNASTSFNFNLQHDQYLFAKSELKKYKLIRNSSLVVFAGSLLWSSYEIFSIYDNYKKYYDAKEGATNLHNDILQSRNIAYITVGSTILSGIATVIFQSRYRSAKSDYKKLSFIPAENGLLLSLQISF